MYKIDIHTQGIKKLKNLKELCVLMTPFGNTLYTIFQKSPPRKFKLFTLRPNYFFTFSDEMSLQSLPVVKCCLTPLFLNLFTISS